MFIFILLLAISFPQGIQHNPIESSLSNQSIEFNIFVDSNDKMIDKVILMYKNIEQINYLNKEMLSVDNYNFNCVLKEHFYNKLDINYYFIVEFKDGGVLSYPIDNPHLINIIHYEDEYWENISSDNEIDLLVLSPLPNSKVRKNDIMIAASMFSVSYVDVENIEIFIDNRDVTSQAVIENNFISIQGLKLSAGEHTVSVHMINKFGIKYSPYSWSFHVISPNEKTWFNKNVKQNFKYWSSYSESNINNNNIEYYDHNLIYNLYVDWLKLTSNIKI